MNGEGQEDMGKICVYTVDVNYARYKFFVAVNISLFVDLNYYRT